jgi:hypothetical protein
MTQMGPTGSIRCHRQELDCWSLNIKWKYTRKKTEMAKEAWLVHPCMNYKCWRRSRMGIRRRRIRRTSSKRNKGEK